MSRANKIRSFTLIEMVLAMLFSAIIVGMAYSAITIFSRLYDNYYFKRSAQADLQLISQAMARDFSQSALIQLDGNKITLRDLSGTSVLNYAVEEDYLIRNAEFKSDSIRMDKLGLRCFYEGRAIESGILDHLVLDFTSDLLPASISITKDYSAEELFVYDDSVRQLKLNSATLWKP
jgi:Tfp pilus assembly protein PilE